MHVVSNQPEVSSPAPSRRRPLPSWLDPSEPHLSRGPFARWPRAADGVLAVVVFAGSLLAVAVSALDDGEDFTIGSIADRPVAALMMLAAAAAALLWRRLRPIAVTASVMAIMVAWAVAGFGDGQELALIVAIYSVGRYVKNYRYSLAIVAAVSILSIVDTIIDSNQRIDIAPAIIFTWLPWYLGLRVRNRGDYLGLLQERAARLEADQQARARQAVADERSRIARELHDVVAHQVSMMTIQAGAAKTIAGDDLDAAVEAMGDVERAGRQALGELRHLLGVLRPDSADHLGNADIDDLGPQPGLADISALVDELTHTGANVSMSVEPLPRGLPAAIDLAIYRIVQECFTNIMKHAGPKPRVHLAVGANESAVVITVDNTTGTAAATGLPASGYGIVGMRERATLLGGTLAAETTAPNGFRVTVEIPFERDRR